MAFVIESASNQSLIRVNMSEPIEKADGLRMKICLGQLLSSRPKNKSLYIVLSFGNISQEDGLPLVQILSNFAEIYHQWRKHFHLEMLLQIDVNLVTVARYLSESFVVPMMFFASEESLEHYLFRQLDDTQPIRPAWADLLGTAKLTED